MGKERLMVELFTPTVHNHLQPELKSLPTRFLALWAQRCYFVTMASVLLDLHG